MKYLTEEERVQNGVNSMDMALEQFFNNVLECIVTNQDCCK